MKILKGEGASLIWDPKNSKPLVDFGKNDFVETDDEAVIKKMTELGYKTEGKVSAAPATKPAGKYDGFKEADFIAELDKRQIDWKTLKAKSNKDKLALLEKDDAQKAHDAAKAALDKQDFDNLAAQVEAAGLTVEEDDTIETLEVKLAKAATPCTEDCTQCDEADCAKRTAEKV